MNDMFKWCCKKDYESESGKGNLPYYAQVGPGSLTYEQCSHDNCVN